MKNVFIINPCAGKEDISGKIIPEISRETACLGVDCTVELTNAPGHARELAHRYARCGEAVHLFSCGGDGTFHEVIQGAAGVPDAAVGCIPYGSGNDFVRNFGPREAFCDIAAMLESEEIPIDLIETEYGFSASICSAGLDAQVAYGIPKFRHLPFCGGSMAYKLSIVEQLCGRIGRSLKIELDGKEMARDCLMIAVCNGSYYGGGFCAAPQALMDDGLLDVILVRTVSRAGVLRPLLAYKSGKHMRDGEVVPELRSIIEHYPARRVHIYPLDGKPMIVNVDGECAARPELHAEMCRLYAKILLPSSLLSAFREREASLAGKNRNAPAKV